MNIVAIETGNDPRPRGNPIKTGGENSFRFCGRLPLALRFSSMGRKGQRHKDARTIPYNGLDLTIAEWAVHTGIAEHLLRGRFKRRWSPERALTEPTMPSQAHNSPHRPEPEYDVWFRLRHVWVGSYDSFSKALGPMPSLDHEVGRLDIAGAYEPGNCRWMTVREIRLNETANILITLDGKKQGLGSWSVDTGLSYDVLKNRCELHWPARDTLTTPLYGHPSFRWMDNAARAVSAARQAMRHRWLNMIYRCHDPKNDAYESYGGRGIAVCERWRNSFDAFLEDVGEPPSDGHTLDRYPDKDGNYEPGNVRWATKTEQQRNMRSNLPLTFRGVTRTLAEWAEISGLPYRALQKRVTVLHWSAEKTLTVPVRGVLSKLKL